MAVTRKLDQQSVDPRRRHSLHLGTPVLDELTVPVGEYRRGSLRGGSPEEPSLDSTEGRLQPHLRAPFGRRRQRAGRVAEGARKRNPALQTEHHDRVHEERDGDRTSDEEPPRGPGTPRSRSLHEPMSPDVAGRRNPPYSKIHGYTEDVLGRSCGSATRPRGRRPNGARGADVAGHASEHVPSGGLPGLSRGLGPRRHRVRRAEQRSRRRVSRERNDRGGAQRPRGQRADPRLCRRWPARPLASRPGAGRIAGALETVLRRLLAAGAAEDLLPVDLERATHARGFRGHAGRDARDRGDRGRIRARRRWSSSCGRRRTSRRSPPRCR